MTARATTDLAEFLAAVADGTRLLGIDLGTKRIGLAVSDAGRALTRPLDTMKRGKFSADAEKLVRICAEHAATGIVLGLPLNMDGSFGPRAQSAKAYGVNLARALSLPVLLFDERLSSFAADDAMTEAGVAASERALSIDAAAAAVILQDALNAMSRM